MTSVALQQPASRRRNAVARWLAADTMNGIRRQRAVLGYLFIAPTIIGLVLFIVIPMISSFALSQKSNPLPEGVVQGKG